MRVEAEDAFVLRTVPFTESSLIVDSFTRGHGRLNLMAKGARRIKSKLRSVLQPFQLISIGWAGRGEVPTITSAVAGSGARALRGEAFYGASHLTELIVNFLHSHDPHPALFDAYLIAMDEVVRETGLPGTLRRFEKKFLAELGFELILETQSDRQTAIERNRIYDYEFGTGPVPADSAGPESVSGETLLALANDMLDTRRTQRESRALLDRAFGWHFQHRAMRSREVYRQTRRPVSVSGDSGATSSGGS